MRHSLACFALLSGFAINAFGASPQLTVIYPRGVQRGTETTVDFIGARLTDAEEIFFYEPGVEVVSLEPVKDNRVRVKLKVAPDCELGEHTAQVRTRSGVSEYKTFYVGHLPAVDEKEPNTFSEPQSLELNHTVNGTVQTEDVDYFIISAKKDQRISVEVEGMLLAGGAMFDPRITVLTPDQQEVAVSDDTALLRQDPALSFVAPHDGNFLIEIRDASYAGNGSSRYRLHVGTFPRPMAVYPAGGQIGQTLDVKFIGDAAGEHIESVTLPAQARDDFRLIAKDDHGMSPSGNLFRLSAHPNSFEQEPNNKMAEGSPAELPNAFNGILQEDGDIDYFKFTARKGQNWEVECYGRRIRSPIDAVMYVYDAKGKRIASDDDGRRPDCYFRFKVPADGEYYLRVNDHLRRGGPEFVYRVEFSPVTPSLTLGIPRVARYSQERQQIVVPRGNRFATLISASRKNLSGELVLDGSNLPPGIKMVAEPMRSNVNTMPVVFEAAADAPIGGKLVDFRARVKHDDPKQQFEGGFRNRADLVRSRPGQTIYAWKDVDKLAFAVVEEFPFHLEIIQPKVPIVRNGSMQLKVVAHKKEGWDEDINVEFRFRPPGIGATSRVRMKKGKNEISYPLSASKGAAIGKWPIYVVGAANVKGNAWVASQMAHLEIAEPFVSFTMARTAVEQGQETEIGCKVQVEREFPGEAKVELLGIPHKTSAETQMISKDTKELGFTVKTEKGSPAGRHKNVFCRVTVFRNGEPIVHSRVGGTELRIDKPLPSQPVAKASPTKKPAKRLSRLQQLRLEAKQRREQAAAAQNAAEATASSGD